MNTATTSFLTMVLGKDGLTALNKALKKDPQLEYYLVPRVLLAWVMQKSEYEGNLPGAEVYVQFKKSDASYTGAIGAGISPVTPFSGDVFGLVAELVVGLGAEVQRVDLRDGQLVRLGKSIDALLKAREALKALSKGGVDLPGKTAAPRAPEGPQEAEEPKKQPKTASKPRLPRLPVLKVELKQLEKSCSKCGSALFKGERFTGCLCWRDLAKHASTTVYSDGAVIEFARGADVATVQALVKELRHGQH